MLDVSVYMELPFGFMPESDNQRGVVLKVVKNLYGLKNASFLWFEMLQKALKDRGFSPSSIDPCIIIKANCAILVYVDDCLAISKNNR